MIRLAQNLDLPLDVAATASAIVGIRGTGKTNTATVIVEQLAAHGQRSIIIDPLDVWWGLKSSADGKSAGLPVVVFGGPHGDLPLNDDDGDRIAEALATERVTAVLSLRHLRKGAQERFVTAFAERLYHLKGKAENRDRVLIAIDEASAFIPQQVTAGSARMVGAIEDLVRRGRASGIGVLLIDQRAASVNKNVLTQCELLIAHRQTHNLDRTAIRTWVEGNDSTGKASKALFDTLAGIGQGDAIGEAWIWSPLFDLFERIRVNKRSTFDSSATPKAGAAPVVPTQMAAPDLDALRALLEHQEDLAKEDPKGKASSKELAELRRELVEAKREIARLKTRLEDALIDGRRQAMREMMDYAGAQLKDQLRIQSTPEAVAAVKAQIEKPVNDPPPIRRENIPAGGISGPQTRMLVALAQFAAIGSGRLSRSNLAVFSDQSPRSSSYKNNLIRGHRRCGHTGRLGCSWRSDGTGDTGRPAWRVEVETQRTARTDAYQADRVASRFHSPIDPGQRHRSEPNIQ
jgi:hypothetical protein